MKKTTTKTEKTVNEVQKLSATKGRAMLEWYGKRAPKSIEWFPAQEKEAYGDIKAKEWNKLFWGDNKQVLAHLLKEYRGKVDLIYIDPPFDSKADYIKKVKLNGQKLQGVEQSVIEEMQYTDIWEKDEYLQFMYERLVVMREMLTEQGSIYLHCDWHKNSHLRLIMDEVFGEDNFMNEIVWHYPSMSVTTSYFPRKHDIILKYAKDANKTYFNDQSKYVREKYAEGTITRSASAAGFNSDKANYLKGDTKLADDVWTIGHVKSALEIVDYPTQKPEKLLERIIDASCPPDGIVLDCFVGSGTTLAVAQELQRKWIGCDINKGSIITTTERLNKIIKAQSEKSAFKVYNVNHYDVFNNDIQARQLLIETYKITELSRGDFDGTLGADYVKIVSPNRVLTKMDITQVIDAIKKNSDLFVAKKVSKQREATFENKVIVICSGVELDVRDFAKKENTTGVAIEIRDIQVDKKDLDFKKPTEASVSYVVKGSKLTIEVKDYYSPLLMKRLELENDGRLSAKERVNLFDFRQAIEHIVIDVNYGEGQKKSKDIAFNAEAFLHKAKKSELVDVTYEHAYEKKGTYSVAIKIVDVLGEEYFETHEVTVK
ncbi:site-specific DNA-methyltransferase [Candidatus Kaiserbacteria bacterium]|nr:site-specific DNA-methyltransferase [Candidatus Kaiserbacteria bacterium]